MSSQPPAPSSGVSRLAFGCGILFGLVFLGGGLLALVQGLRQPSATSDSIVPIVIGSVFTFVGLAIVLAVLFGTAASRRTDALKAANPDKPWMWREDWANRAIRDSTKGKMIGLWIFAIVWNALSFPIAWMMKPEVSRENLMPLLIFLFPAVGVILLISAIYQTMRSARFGTSICHLDRVPIVPGRMFRGDLELKTDAVPAAGYRLRIASINSVTTRSGKNRSTTEHLLWDSEIVVDASAAMRSPMGTRVPFQFATPPDSQPTDDADTYNRFLWRFTASAELPGVDYGAQFDLPVFRAGEAVDGSEFAAFQERHRVEAARQPVATTSGVEIKRLPGGGEEFQIRASKTIGGVIGGLVLLLVWNAAIAAMIHFGAPWGIPLVFIVIDLLLIVSAIDYFFGRSTIEVDASGVRVRKQWLGMGSRETSYETASIKSIDGTTAGVNSLSFGVTLELQDGSKKLLGTNLPSRESADTVAAKMMADLGRA
ncbi:MAG TPA: hypothetical protein VLV78_14310 [Thermoanaerobaculia bacterium]|nr:hypothetical protein [Thermoanaerobaculia bacterium]